MTMTGIAGSCSATRCSDTAACAPKLDDNANGPGRLASDQRTRVSASTDASQSLSAPCASASAANCAGVCVRRGASARSSTFTTGRLATASSISVRLRLELVDAPQEIAEALVRLAGPGVPAEQLVEQRHDGRLVDVVPIDHV